MQIRNNEPLSRIVARQRRIKQRVCERRKRNADSSRSSDAPQMRPSSGNFRNFLRPYFHIIFDTVDKSVCLPVEGRNWIIKIHIHPRRRNWAIGRKSRTRNVPRPVRIICAALFSTPIFKHNNEKVTYLFRTGARSPAIFQGRAHRCSKVTKARESANRLLLFGLSGHRCAVIVEDQQIAWSQVHCRVAMAIAKFTRSDLAKCNSFLRDIYTWPRGTFFIMDELRREVARTH